MNAVESLMAVSTAVLGQDTRNPESQARLLSIGRSTMRRILFLDEREQSTSMLGRVRRAGLRFLHQQLLSRLMDYVIKTLLGWAGRGTVDSESYTPVFDRILNQTAQQKDQLRALIPLLDPNHPGLMDPAD